MASPAIADIKPTPGGTSSSTLSEWSGPYVTDMLGKAQAIADEPYQVYQGPMTAGQSGLQSKVFQGLGNLSFPGILGQSFSSPTRSQQPQTMPAYRGQQPYPAQIPGTGGGMPPPGGFPGYDPYAGRQDTGATLNKGYVPGADPRIDELSGMGGSNMGNWAAKSTGMPMEEPVPDYLYGAGDMRLAVEPFMPGGTSQGVPVTQENYGAGPEMPQLNQLDPSSRFMNPGLDDSNMGMGGGMMGDLKGNYYGPEMGAIGATGGMPMESGTLGQAQTMPQQGGIAGLSLEPPQGSQQPSNIAQSYMNPYLQSVLDPQMAELRRQNDITNMQANAKLTGAGAFGGGRQAIMNAENNRNLMMEQNKTVGQGYANAYDKAMQQFNTEQGQAKTLAEMMAEQGQQERNIEQQGISADYNEFLAQRDDPMKKTQYLQSMLQGLPIQTVTNTGGQLSGIGQLAQTVGGLGSISDSLKKFNLTGG
jgi:hypothetical protein